LSLRNQLYSYLGFFYVILGFLGGYFLWLDDLPLFFIVEGLVLLSLPVGINLVKKAMRPIEFINFSHQVLKQGDFASRITPYGLAELDELAGIYNQMLEKLHNEQLALGEQRGFFDKLLEATPTGIVIFDFEDCMTTVNPAAQQMLGLNGSEYQGKSLKNMATPLSMAIVDNYDQLPMLIPLSNDKRFRVQLSQFYDRGFVRNFLMLEELTEEMHTAEKQAYEKLIRMTSHEVNNTIGATNSVLDSCLDYAEQLDEEDKEDYSHALTVVIDRNRNLAEFMKRLAHVVHLPTPECRPVELVQLIANVQVMFQAELTRRNISWVEQLPSGGVTVNLDVHLFELVLINLIKNAYEAIDKDGVLTVKVENLEKGIKLTIEDSAGILSIEDKHNLFKPFYTTKRNGQGVGLMLIREILNQHDFGYSLSCDPRCWTRFEIFMG
jgi:two-component system nitrogen regulation sensor histidine kinase NtrY